jgi:hypothetical protein
MDIAGIMTRPILHLVIIVIFTASLAGCLGQDDGCEVSTVSGPVEDLVLTEEEMASIDDRWYMVDDIWSGDYYYPNSTVAAVNYWMDSSEGVIAELYIEVYWFESEDAMYGQITLALPLHDGGEEFGDWSRISGDSDLTDAYNQTTVVISEENVGMSIDLVYMDAELSYEDVMGIVSSQYRKVLDAGE